MTDSWTIRSMVGVDPEIVFRHSSLIFLEPLTESNRQIEQWTFEPDRAFGIFDGDQLVGSAGCYTRDVTIPGGPIPVACVSGVGVHPAYRRRGLLTQLMRHQLT